MAEKLDIMAHAARNIQYENLLPQIKSLIGNESDSIANMANVSAALHEAFQFLWVGFYIVKNDELVLGPFQGRIACTRIKYGRGVCGTSWKEKKTLIVADVDEFPGHIACDSESRSEIVVPLILRGEVVGVLDIDSEYESYFSEIDARYLEQIGNYLIESISD